MTANSHNKPVGLLETIGVATFVIGVLAIASTVAWNYWSSATSWETTITERDVATQTERHKFVNQFWAIPLPESSVVENIEYATWLDWDLRATISMETDVAMAYLNAVRMRSKSISTSDTKLFQSESKLEAVFRVTIENEYNGRLVYAPSRKTLTVSAPDFESTRTQPAE